MALQSFRSYVNEPTSGDISIALQQILFAPEGTSFTPGRVDVSSPPAGFVHLGAVAEDSPQLSVQRTLYQLKTGAPRVLRYQATVEITGQVSGVLLSNRNSRAYMSLGGLRNYHVPNTPASAFAAIMTAIDRSQVIVNSVPMTASLVVGDLVVTDTTATLNTSLNEAFVSAITSHAAGFLVTLANPHGFPILPVLSNPFVSSAVERYPLGTSQLPRFHVLGVADFFSGAQVVHDFQLAVPTGQFVEALRAGQEIRMPYSFDLLGYTVSTPYSLIGEQVVAERFWFHPTAPGV